MKIFRSLIKDSLSYLTHGGLYYNLWMAFLTIFMLLGMFCYFIQLDQGLSVTGMNDRVSWGLYISNFTCFI